MGKQKSLQHESMAFFAAMQVIAANNGKSMPSQLDVDTQIKIDDQLRKIDWKWIGFKIYRHDGELTYYSLCG